MPSFLLELLSEEIPARMQNRAAIDLARLTRERLEQAGLTFGSVQTWAGPRRLTLAVDDLPIRREDRVEERKGPRVGAPEAALEGFLRSAGIGRDNLIERDGVWFASRLAQGGLTAEALARIVEAIVRGFPWPKSMTWGAGSLRWVRPLHRILCVFDGDIVPLEIDGLDAADLTEGHRFMSGGEAFAARSLAAYRDGLKRRHVLLDPVERKSMILVGARAACTGVGLKFVEDEGLLEEVAGMVEWPAPLLGEFDPAFLALPPEVIRTSMRHHQRYFAVTDGEGALAPRFVVVANSEAADGGALIAAGAARVLSARLADAEFFWSEDRRRSLASRLETLSGMIFHARLGTMRDRANRIEALARALAPKVSADPDLSAEAGRLAKADLASAMVGEFPELQGVMGSYYARAEGLDPRVADAIGEHYRPQGPWDATPTAAETIAVALADKIDTIAAFFSIGEAPTGSRDPFALRRAALGVIRIVLDNELRLSLSEMLDACEFSGEGVVAFFADRLEVLLRDRGIRHDLVKAVFALEDDDLTRVVRRVETLAAFLAGADGVDLLAAYRRAANILAAEGRTSGELKVSPQRPSGPPAEAALFDALAKSRPDVEAAMMKEDYAAALATLSGLRKPIDLFFDEVLVVSPDPAERANRLALLAEVCAVMSRIADFSLVSG